jgi:hypothetical protein
MGSPASDEPLSILRKPAEPTPRAERLDRSDVPWILTVKLSSGLEVRLMNISSTGTLIESGEKLAHDSVKEVRLCGPDSEIVIPARFVRSEIADVTARGVRYQIGIAFDDYVPLDAPRRDSAGPAGERQLRARVSGELEKAVRSADAAGWIDRGTNGQLERLHWLLTEANALVDTIKTTS